MKYILNKEFALRSWIDSPYSIISKNKDRAIKVGKDRFELLKKCDGIEDIESSDLLTSTINDGYISKAKDGETISEWQQYKRFENIYIPAIFLRVTGICNFNCKHCFNAADINRDTSRWTLGEFKTLIQQAKECGVHSFNFTGGEPLLNPDLLPMIREIYANDMTVNYIVTNAFYFTQKFFDELAQIGCNARFRISFDTLGHHDWMRGEDGVENKCIENIKLCIKNHHLVTINSQVNRITMDSMLKTAEYLESIGVHHTRFIRTSESPRWLQYAKGANLGINEYFDVCIDFIKKFFSKKREMQISLWEFGWFFPWNKKYELACMHCDETLYNDKLPACADRKYEACIGSDGILYPCHQMSGALDLLKVPLPNVKEIGFAEAIKNPEYLKHARMTTGDFIKNSTPSNTNVEYYDSFRIKDIGEHETFDCKTCKHYRQCHGGCRTIGFATGGSFYGPDLFSCFFYKGDYESKIKEVLPSDWSNTVRYCENSEYHEGDSKNLPIDECMDKREEDKNLEGR